MNLWYCYGAFTLYGALLKETCSVLTHVAVDIRIWTWHRDTLITSGSLHAGLNVSLFTRRYWGNHVCFLFLRLVICLNSAGTLAWCEVVRMNFECVVFFCDAVAGIHVVFLCIHQHYVLCYMHSFCIGRRVRQVVELVCKQPPLIVHSPHH